MSTDTFERLALRATEGDKEFIDYCRAIVRDRDGLMHENMKLLNAEAKRTSRIDDLLVEDKRLRDMCSSLRSQLEGHREENARLRTECNMLREDNTRMQQTPLEAVVRKSVDGLTYSLEVESIRVIGLGRFEVLLR
jgi:hypothetical protein